MPSSVILIPSRRRLQPVPIRLTRANMFIGVMVFSIFLISAIDGFSPVKGPLRIQERISMDKYSSRVSGDDNMVLYKKFQDSSSLRQITSLRGGFILPLIENPIWKSIGIYGIADFIIGFLLSIFTGSHLHLDLVGTGVFAVAALPYMTSGVGHIRWSSLAIVLWGTKLALFLFFRATQVKYDYRLVDLLASSTGAFQFWFTTFLWNILVSMPYLLGLNSDRDNSVALMSGAAMYLVGLTIETIADAQKYFFKQQQVPAGASQFCNVGLWKYSQHPNWFGNLLLWSGILVMNLPALIEPIATVIGGDNDTAGAGFLMQLWSLRKLILGCLGPWFLWVLFNGQAKGTITNAMELANSKYGNDPEYAKYIRDVPLIIPKLKFW